jgi:hypothetical protein
MSGTSKLTSIRCTACGAPLSLHGGGHKIQTLNCTYCGAVMDVKKEYAVLAQFRNQSRPPCPLELGMQGTLKGVAFTVIGMIGYFAENTWTDLLLFSPTHGYAWLTYELGHFTFARRTRACLGSTLWTEAVKHTIPCGDKTFRLYERYEAEITYVAGELTWLAKVGDRNWQAEAIAPPYLLSAEKTDQERELYLCEYLPPEEVYQSFNLAGQAREPRGIHPAQPYQGTHSRAVSRASWPFAALALLVALFIWLFMDGRNVYYDSIPVGNVQAEQQTREFTITQPGRLVALDLSTSLENAWLYFEINLMHNGEEVYSLGKEVSYYEGYEDGEHWSEGSRSATALFKVPEAGIYSLVIQAPEGGTGDSSEGPPQGTVTLDIREGVVGSRYFFILSLLAGVAALWYPLQRWRFEQQRWLPVTGDSDDDGDNAGDDD